MTVAEWEQWDELKQKVDAYLAALFIKVQNQRIKDNHNVADTDKA